jgi:dynamin 1-like protein
VNHIREKLPELRTKLSTLIGQTQHELSQYGDAALSGPVHQVKEMRKSKTKD